jgi:hypothetical protein
LVVSTLLVSFFTQVKAITWSVNVKQLTTYAYLDGYPALTQTKDGRVWLVWAKEILGNLTLFYKISSNFGKTWSDESNLTNEVAPGHSQNPSIMQAQNGTIWVAWTSDRPPPPQPPTPDFYMTASPQNLIVPQGGSGNSKITVTSVNGFSEAVRLSVLDQPQGVSTSLNPTQVTPPPNGAVDSTLTILVDPTATPENYVFSVLGRSSSIGHTIDINLEITVVGGASHVGTGAYVTQPSSTSSSGGIQDYEIYYKTSHDNGATWSKDIQVTNDNMDDLRPAIIQLANGTIMFVWQRYTSANNHDICYKTTMNGASWSDTKQLTTDGAHDKAPAVWQARDGKIWVVWSSTRTGDYEIFYNTYNGVIWLGDTRLTYDTNSDVQPAIVQAINGDIMIFWASGIATGSYDIYYKYSSTGGSSWSAKIAFATGNYEDNWPGVTRTQDTKIWVVWMQNPGDGNWEIYCRTSLAGDVNGDNIVNVMDLTLVSLSYGTMEGEPGYNPDADINKDGIADMRDLRIVAYYLGET